MSDKNKFVINTPETTSETSTVETQPRFPVRSQLAIIVGILSLIFISVIVPQTLALFNKDSEVLSVPNNAAFTIENKEIFLPKKIEGLNLKATSAYVWDIIGQRSLYAKEPDKKLPLASITKLMTTLVAYEVKDDSTKVVVSSDAALEQSGGGITAGEVFVIKELADFALITSFNSAAHVLGESVGRELGLGDPLGQFVAAMNIKAKELNLNSLEFYNVTGLDIDTTRAGSYGSARDVSFLMEYIYLSYPQILLPTVAPRTRLYNQAGQYHEAENTNDAVFDIPNLLGSKTGYTDLAGGNLTVIFDAGFNRPIVVTVLGSSRNERFADVKNIIKEVQNSMTQKN